MWWLVPCVQQTVSSLGAVASTGPLFPHRASGTSQSSGSLDRVPAPQRTMCHGGHGAYFVKDAFRVKVSPSLRSGQQFRESPQGRGERPWRQW